MNKVVEKSAETSEVNDSTCGNGKVNIKKKEKFILLITLK